MLRSVIAPLPEGHVRHASRGLCGRCHSRQRRQDPSNAEADKAASRRWKAKHREHTQQYDRAYGDTHRSTCERCGQLMGALSTRPGRPNRFCRSCHLALAQERRALLQRLWHEGRSLKEIAAALGTTTNGLSTTMAQMRRAGYDLPYRYRLSRPSPLPLIDQLSAPLDGAHAGLR